METTAIFNNLSELLKPGSVILGLMFLIQGLHKILDSSRVYKIKQLELLHSCMKDLDSVGCAYTIEMLLKRAYKVHIPYEHAMVIMVHPQRQKLFDLYRASYKYIHFEYGQFSLLPKYSSKKAACIEKHKHDALNAIKYYASSSIGAALVIIAFNEFYATGLFEIRFYTYNIIWFMACLVASTFLSVVAFLSLIDPTSIEKAQKFKEHFDNGAPTRKVIWAY